MQYISIDVGIDWDAVVCCCGALRHKEFQDTRAYLVHWNVEVLDSKLAAK